VRTCLRVAAVILSSTLVLTAATFTVAIGQRGPSCPYSNGPPACGINQHPDAINAALGGSRITIPQCASSINAAIASLYAYDDGGCRPANSTVSAWGHHLKFVNDAGVYLPPNYRQEAIEGDFHGAFFCDSTANLLILAFCGSVSLTQLDRNNIEDWFNTNLLQHLGTRPKQYLVAQDVVWQLQEFWKLGRFDGVCGAGRPTFVLSGHSKGGGQAQFAAVRSGSRAIVLNSDPVNELIFSDWLFSPDALEIVQRMQAIGRGIRSLYQCKIGAIDGELTHYIASTNSIRDIRMVNDIIAVYLLPHCNLPHAPIEWIADTLACSSGSVMVGHSIETVVRELHACLQTTTAQPTQKP
jgi:hypothetical protein